MFKANVLLWECFVVPGGSGSQEAVPSLLVLSRESFESSTMEIIYFLFLAEFLTAICLVTGTYKVDWDCRIRAMWTFEIFF